jgi:NAD(P)-dependent dehydrogenase (short-subunit alcohol dehydrogenase family)
MRGRVAVVTGAARGIGRGVAERLAADGAAVVLVDRDEGVAGVAAGLAGRTDAAAGLAGRTDAAYLIADLADAARCASVIPEVIARYGRVDVLVNNAAFLGRRLSFLDTDLDDWRKVIDTNLTAAMVLGRDAARDMVARQSGAIVNITSIQEDLPVSAHTSYVASKGGLSALTRAMAVELSPLGVRVNAVAPGAIDSPSMADTLRERDADTSVTPPTLLRRFGTPEEVAAAVAFLCSDAAAFCTGATLHVDAGRRLSRYPDPLGEK